MRLYLGAIETPGASAACQSHHIPVANIACSANECHFSGVTSAPCTAWTFQQSDDGGADICSRTEEDGLKRHGWSSTLGGAGQQVSGTVQAH